MKRLLLILLSIVLVGALVFGGCAEPAPAPAPPPAPAPAPAPPPAPPAPPPKDKIVLGAARSYSGPLAVIGESFFNPLFSLWLEETNAKGGIYVPEYDKRLPIEVIKYDDKSDRGLQVRMLEKLILEDKVDFIVGPCGTGMLFAAAPVANKHKYLLIGAEGGSITLRDFLPAMPYVFPTIQDALSQLPPLVEWMAEKGVKTVALTGTLDLHGVENAEVALAECGKAGLEVVMYDSFPLGAKDLSPLIKKAMALNVDAWVSAAYPDEFALMTSQAMELGFNPKVFFVTVGPCIGAFLDVFGADAMEGIIGGGAWNGKQGPKFKWLEDQYTARIGFVLDYWGAPVYWASFEALEMAIERVGSLDQKKIRDVIATEKFETSLGLWWWEDQVVALDAYAGVVGQWQNGYWEVIFPKAKATAEPIFPKPPWPTK